MSLFCGVGEAGGAPNGSIARPFCGTKEGGDVVGEREESPVQEKSPLCESAAPDSIAAS